MNKLSKKQRAFIYYRARGYSLVDSVIKAGYRVKTRDNGYKIGSQLNAKLEIRERIDKERLEVFDTSMITEDYILTNLKEIAENGKVEANKVRANELLGKARALFTDKQITEGTLNIKKEQEIQNYINDRLKDVKGSKN